MKRKDTKYISIAEFDGMLPPYDIDMERVVLGSLMLERHTMQEAERFLEPDVFYDQAHQEIYRAIYKLFVEKQPFDIMTVTNQLRADKELNNVGGVVYVAQLTNRVGGTGNIQYHAAILRQKWIQRKLIITGHQMVKVGYDDTKDCFDAIDEADLSIKAINISIQAAQTNLTTFRDLMKLEADDYDAVVSGKAPGVMTNNIELDRVTNGFQPGDLIIMAARPGKGKSVAALNFAKSVAKQDEPVAFFSLEMPSIQLMHRLASDEADIDFKKIKERKTTDAERSLVNTALGKIENLPLYIDDASVTTILGIWSKAARIKSTYGLKMVVVDYLQLIQTPELGKYIDANASTSHITRNLKLMAKDLGVPVIALSQLSREVEKVPSRRPSLNHLRDSGSIEQDADMVIFIYRPAYYKSQGLVLLDDYGKEYADDYAEFMIAKHRNGEVGNIVQKFTGNRQRFESPQNNYLVKDFTEPLKPNNNFDDENDKPF